MEDKNIYNKEEIIKLSEDLPVGKRKSFCGYVFARGFVRRDNYIKEWIKRFSDNQEVARSDVLGQELLNFIDDLDLKQLSYSEVMDKCREFYKQIEGREVLK